MIQRGGRGCNSEEGEGVIQGGGRGCDPGMREGCDPMREGCEGQV